MKNFLILLVMLFLPLSFVNSQVKGFGAGIIIGEPTGISFKNWLSSNSAIDAAIGWSFVKTNSLHIHADYLLHTSSLISSSSGSLPFYYGIGGRIKLKNDNDHEPDSRIGVRAPLGLTYQFNDAPVDIFVEIVPILDLNPATDFSINSGLGFRYYFH